MAYCLLKQLSLIRPKFDFYQNLCMTHIFCQVLFDPYCMLGVGKLRPASQIRPNEKICKALEAVFIGFLCLNVSHKTLIKFPILPANINNCLPMLYTHNFCHNKEGRNSQSWSRQIHKNLFNVYMLFMK